jgi:hypothetical protein
MTVPVTNASTNYFINEVRIVNYDNFKIKLFKTLEMNYKKAPSYIKIVDLLADIFHGRFDYINDLNREALFGVTRYLDINTEMIISSGIKKNKELKAEAKVIDICRILDGDVYINPIGGQELYSKENFQKAGIHLKFVSMNDIIYKQGEGDFIPNLSIIDVLMWNTKDDLKSMLNDYVLLEGKE